MKSLVSWENLPEVISAKEAAAIARVSPDLIRKLAKNNLLPFPYVKLGNRIRISRDLFRKWIETNGQSFSTSENGKEVCDVTHTDKDYSC